MKICQSSKGIFFTKHNLESALLLKTYFRHFNGILPNQYSGDFNSPPPQLFAEMLFCKTSPELAKIKPASCHFVPNQVITVHQPEGEARESADSEEQSQASVSQQVFVALAGEGEGHPPAEVVEVNMYDLLNNSVTFICEGKPSDL